MPFTHGLGRTREYVEIVRAALARERLEHAGPYWTLPLGQGEGLGLGKPLKLLATPVQKRIPIYLGAIGPKAVEQTGAIADGWLPFLFNVEQPEVLLDPLRAGASRAGRDVAEIDVAPVVPVAVADTVADARDLVRPWITFYLGAMGAKAKNFYVELADRYGFGDSARACQDAFLAGDRLDAAAALSDELIDAGTIATTPDRLPERVAAYAAAGATTLVVVPSGERADLVRALGELSRAGAGVG